MAKKKTSAAARAPGRPRSDASRAAILKAAYQLLREGGFAQFTVEGVAARAGAGKATIYRWWTSKGTLAVEAFLVAAAPKMDAIKDSGSPIEDLRRQVQQAATIYRGRAGQLMRELMALKQADSETDKQLFADFFEPRRKAAMVTLNRAKASGELRPGTDLEVLADALWGPIFHRLLVTQDVLSKTFIDKLVDMVFHGAVQRPTA
ncbi:MAG: TetR/AcrR family transcriptional regulator [Proteobacteria bacterium]|nr:TetR/AcrR family transcriptional regulator [Pseudomonadota bacterium]